MDGESSYESDISESWSLIDVNLNEESVLGDEAQILVHNSSSDENKTQPESNELELEKDKKRSIGKSLNRSQSDPSLRNEEACDSEELEEIYRKSSDEENKTDSDSIEILDIDGNYRGNLDAETDIDRLDISFLHNQDDKLFTSEEESFYRGNVENNYKNLCSAVIKVKKRKLSRHSDTSSIDSVNSDCSSTDGKYYSKIHSSDVYGDHLSLQNCVSGGRPVYKHYRNNVANTVLSLSMGVIFAGVACIAIGHFLGVHDAGETAAELMESLKKLQMENIALQSRLSYLNRAFQTRDLNSKPNFLPNESLENNYCVRKRQGKFTKSEYEASAIHKVSISSLGKLSSSSPSIKTKSNLLKNEKEGDVLNLLNNIHDQLTNLNVKVKNERLRESRIKISKVVQKIMDKLIHSKDKYEVFLQLNDIVKKILPDNGYCAAKEKVLETEQENIIPVTENDLHSVKWMSKKQEEELKENVIFPHVEQVIIFPQPREYYEVNETGSRNETTSINNEEKVVVETSERSFIRPLNEDVNLIVELKADTVKSTNKKKHYNKINRIKREKRKLEKKSKKVIKSKEELSAKRKRKDKVLDKRQKFLLKKARQTFNETKKFQAKIGKVVKKALNDAKPKRSLIKKKSKKSKFKRVFVSSLFQKQISKDKGTGVQKCHQMGPGFKYQKQDLSCVNLTGDWVFKWSDGRQEFRRHQTLGDWQFDRAKGRRELRDEDFALNWQFKRALARENYRNDDTYKIRSFNQKGFFHEDHSWF